MDKKDFIETVIGGIFAVIAVGAAIAEVIINGVSSATVVAGIKDVFGTLVIVLVFLAFIKDKKKAKNVRESIEVGMEKLEEIYAPLLREEKAPENSQNKANKLKKIIRYEIAGHTEVLSGSESKEYAPFFELEAENAKQVRFYIRRKFFGDTETHPFDAEKIAGRIEKYIKKKHQEFNIVFRPDDKGGKLLIEFPSEIKYKTDVEKLISLIEDAVFIYVVENKK